jgi:hypothetical protein
MGCWATVARRPREGLFARVIGLGTLVFAAVGVVVQLKDELNTVWEVKTPPGARARVTRTDVGDAYLPPNASKRLSESAVNCGVSVRFICPVSTCICDWNMSIR